MPSSSVPVPEWWLGSQDSLQAVTHAAPCAAHPALLLPLSAAYLPPTSVAMASVDDAASCVVQLTCRDPPAATDDDLAAAPALPHLKALVLEACGNLTAAAMRHVSQSKTLEDLRLDGTPVDDDGFQHLAGLAPTLRRLSIAHCRGTSIDGFKSILDAAALSHITTLDGLTELDVHGCHNVGPDGVSSLAALSRLTKLDIGCCGVDDASLTNLSASPPSLKWLCLHKCGSVPAAVFAALPRLTHLDVSYCTLDAAGVTHISSMAALTSLNLWRAEGVTSEAFVTFTALTNLRELNLDGCQEITAAALAPLAVLPNLTDVNTDDTAALDELDEMIALVKRLSPPACPINSLTLFVHQFDDDDDHDDGDDHADDVDGVANPVVQEEHEEQDTSVPPAVGRPDSVPAADKTVDGIVVGAHHQEQSETDTSSDEDASSAPGRVVDARVLYTYVRRAMEDGDESRARKLLLQADACDIGDVLRHAVAAERWDNPLACRILSLLIDHADPSTFSADFVIVVFRRRNQAAARQLVERGASFPALHKAALFGDNDAAALVLQQGMNVNNTNPSLVG